MRVLFDNGAPDPIATVLRQHQVTFARDRGWRELKNGDLIAVAEAAGFDVLLTTDKNIRHQQNLTSRHISFVVLVNSQWPMVRQHLAEIAGAVDGCKPGTYTEASDTFPLTSHSHPPHPKLLSLT